MRRRGQISYHSQKNHQFAARCKGHIRQHDALDMFDEIRGSDLTVPAATMSMIPALGGRAACRSTGDVHDAFSELLLKMTF
jgi:hypothetical protein